MFAQPLEYSIYYRVFLPHNDGNMSYFCHIFFQSFDIQRLHAISKLLCISIDVNRR